MNQALTPWSVKGIDEETRKTARQKAKEAGLPIGTWIDKIILEQQAQVFRNDSNLLNSEEQNAYEPKESIKEHGLCWIPVVPGAIESSLWIEVSEGKRW